MNNSSQVFSKNVKLIIEMVRALWKLVLKFHTVQ